MKTELIPAILAETREQVESRLAAVERLAPLVQLDVMEPPFVPHRSWADAGLAAEWPLAPAIELHIMSHDPTTIIRTWQHVRCVKRAIWHIEADVNHHTLIEQVRRYSWEVGLAISPDTPLEKIDEYTPLLDECLVLGVTPGASGQTILEGAPERIAALCARHPQLVVGIDGGVHPETIQKLIFAGAKRLYTASALFHTHDIDTQFEKLKKLCIF